MDLHPQNENLALRENADTRFDDAYEMYGSYGAHISDDEGCLEIQAINPEDLDTKSDEEISEASGLSQSTLDELLPLCRRVLEDMEEIASEMQAAVDAYERGEREECIDCLRNARYLETEHGDDPATSDLADRLLVDLEEEN